MTGCSLVCLVLAVVASIHFIRTARAACEVCLPNFLYAIAGNHNWNEGSNPRSKRFLLYVPAGCASRSNTSRLLYYRLSKKVESLLSHTQLFKGRSLIGDRFPLR